MSIFQNNFFTENRPHFPERPLSKKCPHSQGVKLKLVLTEIEITSTRSQQNVDINPQTSMKVDMQSQTHGTLASGMMMFKYRPPNLHTVCVVCVCVGVCVCVWVPDAIHIPPGQTGAF